jgi:hypothetical protein
VLADAYIHELGEGETQVSRTSTTGRSIRSDLLDQVANRCHDEVGLVSVNTVTTSLCDDEATVSDGGG